MNALAFLGPILLFFYTFIVALHFLFSFLLRKKKDREQRGLIIGSSLFDLYYDFVKDCLIWKFKLTGS